MHIHSASPFYVLNTTEKDWNLFNAILNPPKLNTEHQERLLEFSQSGNLLLLGCIYSDRKVYEYKSRYPSCNVYTMDKQPDDSPFHIQGDFNKSESFSSLNRNFFNCIVFDNDTIKYVTHPRTLFSILYSLLVSNGILYITLNNKRKNNFLVIIDHAYLKEKPNPLFIQNNFYDVIEYYYILMQIFNNPIGINNGIDINKYPFSDRLDIGEFVLCKNVNQLSMQGKRKRIVRRTIRKQQKKRKSKK